MPFPAILLPQLRALGGLGAALFCSLFVSVAVAIAEPPLVYRFEFAGEPGVPTEAWMGDRNFLLEHDAKEPDKIHLVQSDGALHIEVNKKSFGLDTVPMVSGISIEVDTADAMNDGKAAAFVERIDFLE